MWFLFLAGCLPTAPVDTGAAVGSDTAPEPPAWTAADVATELPLLLADGIPDPWTVNAHYVEMVEMGDEICPGPDNQLQMPEGTCETENGYTFYGVATWWDLSTDTLDAFEMFSSSFVITPPDGAPFRSGGGFGYAESEDQTWSGHVDGGFIDTDRTDWLATGASSALTITGTTTDDTLALHGGVAIGARAVWFEDVSTGGTCGGAVSGVLRVRDPDGAWYDVDFGDACTGCGAVSYAGAPLGEACVDLSGPFDGLRAARAARVAG